MYTEMYLCQTMQCYISKWYPSNGNLIALELNFLTSVFIISLTDILVDGYFNVKRFGYRQGCRPAHAVVATSDYNKQIVDRNEIC